MSSIGVDANASQANDGVWPRGWYRFPLKPLVRYRKADQWNTAHYGFHWLGFGIWTLDSIELGFGVELEHSLMFWIRLPYLKILLAIPLFNPWWLQKFWRKAEGMKRE